MSIADRTLHCDTKTDCIYSGCRHPLGPCLGPCQKTVTFNPSHGLTPLHLEIVLWYHTRGADMPNLDAPAVREYLKHLIDAGMVEIDGSENLRSYRTTDKGAAWLDYLLTVPFPEQRWEVVIRESA